MLDDLQRMERMENEYERLAYCVREFISSYAANPEKLESDGLVRELGRLGLDVMYPDDLVEQLRTYCEWHCNTFPVDLARLSSRFEAVLRFLHRESLDDPTPENVLRFMGFKPLNPVREGLFVLLQNIQATHDKLSKSEESSVPILTRKEIHGAVEEVFSHVEELLEYIISFYTRVLARGASQTGNVLEIMENAPDILGFRKSEMSILRKWVNGKWDKLILSRSLPVLHELNRIVNDSNLECASIFQELFSGNQPPRKEVVSTEELDKVNERFSGYRHKYAHQRQRDEVDLTEYQSESKETVSELLKFASYLEREKIIPEVVIVLRRINMGDGSTRLDCLHHDTRIRPHRFSNFCRFYWHRKFHVECFFPVHILQKIDKDRYGEEQYLRVMMPVNFRLPGLELI